jgi:hypothetical protein
MAVTRHVLLLLVEIGFRQFTKIRAVWQAGIVDNSGFTHLKKSAAFHPERLA